MTTPIRRAAAVAGILAALALPVGACAATTSNAPPQKYDLQTQLVDRYHAGVFEGRLVLTVYPDGIVQGNYRPADGGVRSVTGGIDGTSIWLDLGTQQPLHLTGTLQNGVLKTTAELPGLDVYEFDSVNVTPSR